MRRWQKKFGFEEYFIEGKMTWWMMWKPQIWRLFEAPKSSLAARLLNILSMVFALLSIFSMILITIPELRIPEISVRNIQTDSIHNTINNTTLPQIFPPQLEMLNSKALYEFQIIDFICNAFFTVELLTRFLTCPSKKVFVRRLPIIIDLIALISFYADLTIFILGVREKVNEESVIMVVDLIRIFRVLQISKLIRHLTEFQLLFETIRASARELYIWVYCVAMFVIIFGTVMYYAERMLENNPNNSFVSIPHSMWWAVVTMCTVGYGDMVPKTGLGMTVGSLCAIAGVITISLPVPFFVSTFEMYYSHRQARAKMPKMRRKIVHVSEIRKNLNNNIQM